MAIKKSVKDILDRAEKYKSNEKIALAITALVALGESATHSNTEFKKLKVLVETAEAQTDNVDEKNNEVEALETFGEDKEKLEEYGKKFGIDLDRRNAIETMYEELIVHIEKGDESNTKDEGANNGASSDKSVEKSVEENTENDAGENDAEEKIENDGVQMTEEDEVVEEPKAKKVYDYAGVRMIGAKWYCSKDKYKKGFATANECAEHFNG